jgi:hypothetical protein
MAAHIAFFIDPSTKMTFEQVKSEATFTVLGKQVPNFNITKDAIWGRIKFTTKQNSDWYFNLDPASYNKISAFQKDSAGQWKEEIQGNAYPNSSRPLPVNHYLFKIKIVPGDTAVFYFRIQDYYPQSYDISVGTLESFLIHVHNNDLYNGICYGIMIMMLIYNFYLYLTQRARIYIYYVLYIFCSMVFSAYLGGYALHMPNFILKLIAFAPIIPPAGFGIFGLLFTMALFKEVLTERFKKVLYLFMILAFMNTVISTTPLVYLSENIIQPLGLVLGILCFVAAFQALRKKHTAARFYLFGFGAYMSSLFYLISAAQGFSDFNDFTWHALATGSAIESIMLSFALGDKFNVILKEKAQAQAEALAQAQENARLIAEQNSILERKVKERTAELEEKNKEITDSIQYASRIQKALITSEKYIDRQLKKLSR